MGSDAGGVDPDSPGDRPLHRNLVGTSCAQVTPVAPTVTPAQCVAGAATTHRITPATTTNITYTLSPAGSPAGTYPPSPAQNVTVTATLAGVRRRVAGHVADRVVEGRTRQPRRSRVALPAIACTPVQPVAPTVTPSDLRERCRHRAHGGGGHDADGCVLRREPRRPVRRHGEHHGDRDRDARGRVRVGSDAGRLDAGRPGHGTVHRQPRRRDV